MLAADKDQIYAHVRHQALELRKTELDQLVQRYCSLIGISSIASGFAFSGLVEFEVDEAVLEARAADQRIVGFHHMFYYCGAISLMGRQLPSRSSWRISWRLTSPQGHPRRRASS